MPNLKPLLTLLCLLSFFVGIAQPFATLSKGEATGAPVLTDHFFKSKTIGITQPPSSPVRAMAEWEELEAIAIAWSAFWEDAHRDTLLARITAEAIKECDVVILCDLCDKIEENFKNISGLNDLTTSIVRPDGTIQTTEIIFKSVAGGSERIWIRDYGAHTIYTNDVDSLLFVDWKYNPAYPQADTIPSATFAEQYTAPLYITSQDDYALRLDGGNFLTDGLGTAFSSDLVRSRNSFCEGCNPVLTAKHFMGINRYHIMPRLLYDEIHHVDMYMKIMDEETLLFGEYPPEAADYHRLEASIQSIRDNLRTPYGNEYKILRIAMPPDQNGEYPGLALGESAGCSAIGLPCFRTYVNALFVNKTILVPTYGIPYDETALNIWREAKPGFNVIGIDCNGIIPQYGAIHCVTKEIGVANPLWISHAKKEYACMRLGDLTFDAQIKHNSGIASAYLHFRERSDVPFTAVEMFPIDEDNYQTYISMPNQGTKLEYFFSATANSGKTITRPLPAPIAYWKLEVRDCMAVDVDNIDIQPLAISPIFPNPVNNNLQLKIHSLASMSIQYQVFNLLGQPTDLSVQKRLNAGENLLHLSTHNLENGLYWLQISSKQGQNGVNFVVQH